jgi:hypothetical protein
MLALAGAADAHTDSAAIIMPIDCASQTAFADEGTTYVSGSCYDWGVTPSYTDTAYVDNAAADTAEPPPPTPVTAALPTWRNLYDWPNGHGYVGWYAASSSQPGAYGAQSALGGQYGLWLWPAGGSSYSYSSGNYVEWTYTAPGTTRIATAEVLFAYRNKLLAHHCIDVGFRTETTIVYHNEHCKPAAPPDSQRQVTVSLVDPSTNPTTKTLYFRIRVDCGGATTCSKNVPALDPLSTGGFARLLKVDMTLVDDDTPSVVASGPFADLSGTYINGTKAYALTVSGSDPGSGIQRSWVDWSGHGELVSSNNTCDPTHRTPALDARICAATSSFTTSVDTSVLPEATNVFVARASDVAANTGYSDLWTVAVDRTPPPPVSGIALWSYDPATGVASIGFSGTEDPFLPDGTPGSGTSSFTYRYNIGGGEWSAWSSTDDTAFEVTGVPNGSVVNVEIKAVDGASNESAASSGAVTATALPEPPDDSQDGLSPGGSGNYDFDFGSTSSSSTGSTSAAATTAAHDCVGFVGDPQRTGLDINLYSYLDCNGRVIARAHVCIQRKKKRRFWFDTWRDLKCGDLRVGLRKQFDDIELFTTCLSGKHTYRGIARATFLSVPSGQRGSGGAVSLHYLTTTC